MQQLTYAVRQTDNAHSHCPCMYIIIHLVQTFTHPSTAELYAARLSTSLVSVHLKKKKKVQQLYLAKMKRRIKVTFLKIFPMDMRIMIDDIVVNQDECVSSPEKN